MDPVARLHSANLEQIVRPLAQWTVQRHDERAGGLDSRYGHKAHSAWVAETEIRLRHLAQALAVRRPALFVKSIQWTSEAFAARSFDTQDVRTSLECLREVLAEELPAALADVVAPYVEAGLAGLDDVSAPTPPPLPDPAAPHGTLALQFLEALLAGERRRAERLVLATAETGTSVPDLYAHVLRPALVSIGQLWHAGELSVADEHAATAAAESIMSALRLSHAEVAPRGTRMIATAAPGELHGIGIRMVADIFELDGWTADYLGPNMPIDGVLDALRRRKTHLLAASATSFLHVRALGDLVEAVKGQDDLQGVIVLVGGVPLRAIEDLWQELGADGCADSAEEALSLANRLVPA